MQGAHEWRQANGKPPWGADGYAPRQAPAPRGNSPASQRVAAGSLPGRKRAAGAFHRRGAARGAVTVGKAKASARREKNDRPRKGTAVLRSWKCGRKKLGSVWPYAPRGKRLAQKKEIAAGFHSRRASAVRIRHGRAGRVNQLQAKVSARAQRGYDVAGARTKRPVYSFKRPVKNRVTRHACSFASSMFRAIQKRRTPAARRSGQPAGARKGRGHIPSAGRRTRSGHRGAS